LKSDYSSGRNRFSRQTCFTGLENTTAATALSSKGCIVINSHVLLTSAFTHFIQFTLQISPSLTVWLPSWEVEGTDGRHTGDLLDAPDWVRSHKQYCKIVLRVPHEIAFDRMCPVGPVCRNNDITFITMIGSDIV